MILHEAGPFKVFTRLRTAFGAENDPDGWEFTPARGVLGCIYCLSVWIGLVHVFLPMLVCLPFAFSAGVIFVQRRHASDG